MVFTDQIGVKIELKNRPIRIISVVPSQTELLYDLCLGNDVVGITNFCIHPEDWFRTKSKVGGTKNLNLKKIIELKPDIIFANKEENNKADIDELRKQFAIWTSDITDLHGAIEMISCIGEICEKPNEAFSIISTIRQNFSAIEKLKNLDCVYLIWNKPIMSIGGDTFISDMLNEAGLKSLTSNLKRYPILTEIDLIELKPTFLLLSSEPFPFKEKHIQYFQKLLPSSKIMKVDGEMFSWYGSRLIKTTGYFSELRLKIENAS